MAAAPADFRAAAVADGKLARRDGASSCAWSRPRTSSPRLAATAPEGQTIVGFAAEHGGGGVERARAKLTRKGADLIVLNDVSDPAIGFESERQRGNPDRRGPARPPSRSLPRTRSPRRSSTGSTSSGERERSGLY